jgi:hypothetical protein
MVKEIRENMERVLSRIRIACEKSGRSPDEVLLMAVSKTQPFEVVAAAIQAGLRNLGENRVQEAVEKKEAISLEASWELIGHLQTNKARLAVTHFDRIQSVDRLKLIQALDRHCHELGRERLPVLLQVNAGDDPAKFGTTVDNAEGLAEAIVGTPHLQLDGLMTVPPLDQDRMVARKCFARLCKLRDKLRVNLGQSLDVLSMGMSGDFEEAIAEGSTLIRVGTALFGSRD